MQRYLPFRIGVLTRGVAQRRCIPMPHPRANIMNPHRTRYRSHREGQTHVFSRLCTHVALNIQIQRHVVTLRSLVLRDRVVENGTFRNWNTSLYGAKRGTLRRYAPAYMQRHANRRGKIITDKQCVNTRYTQIQRGHICHYIRISTKTVVADIKYVLHEVVTQFRCIKI